MLETPFLEWLLKVSNFAVIIGANLMVQSTIIIAVGLTAVYALRKKGAAVQSLVLRAFLVTVLLSPFASSHFNTSGVRELTFGIPPASLDRPEETPPSLQSDPRALTSTHAGEFHNDLRETICVIKNEYSATIPFSEKDTQAFLNRTEKSPSLSQHANKSLQPIHAGEALNFQRETTGFTELAVYNMAGQKIRELVSADMTPGVHSVVWDGRDENGTPVSSGVYISRLKTGDNVFSNRMMLVK